MKTLQRLPQVKEMITQTGCLLDYPYFKDTYKMIAVDLNRH